MMEFEAKGYGVQQWVVSRLKTPKDLQDGARPVVTPDGLRFAVRLGDGSTRLYRWVDPDPLVEAILIENARGAT